MIALAKIAVLLLADAARFRHPSIPTEAVDPSRESHPSADWTLQQFRDVIGYEETHRYLIHDRDSLFARPLDESIKALGLSVLKSPLRCPKANAICERVIGTIRHKCLDWVIPLSEAHIQLVLKEWVTHYNLQSRSPA